VRHAVAAVGARDVRCERHRCAGCRMRYVTCEN
jgi:hypothetical protein